MRNFLIFLVGFVAALAPLAAVAERPVDYARQIRPILVDRCYACHGPDDNTREGELRLDLREPATRKAIVAGEPETSPLIARLTTDDPNERMPPADSNKEGLTEDQIELMRRWIAEGAMFDEHWSFVKVRMPELPDIEDTSWPAGPIDHFILARIEAEGLGPAPAADAITLARRLHFDLLGLPPKPNVLNDFQRSVARNPDTAIESLVDRLLESPHFGERMASYWLDVVRYADSCGYHGDQTLDIAPYRDYVIRAFNDNMPLDRFVTEQLAGDLLPDPTLWQKVASGFNRLNMTTEEGGAQHKEYLAIYAADRVRNTSTALLGVTMGCAQCHDHKFDPFTMKDFYSFVAFFADIDEPGRYPGGVSRPPVMAVPSPAALADLAALEQKIADIEARLEQADADGGLEQLDETKQSKKSLLASQPKTLITVSVTPRDIRILPRGNWLDESGPVVEPAIPTYFGALGVSGRATRLDLARWVVSRDNPLTARVFVNRVWKLLFGEGLVSSLDDFGSQGQAPSHPDLLDWLAADLMQCGWDVKRMIKEMVTSSTYRQSSRADGVLRKRDPYNRLLARQGRFRLDAEMIRDNALCVSGLLVPHVGGASAKPYQPAGYYAHLNFPAREYQADTGPNQYRRGVYTHWQRTFLHPAMLAFDAPSREECTVQRPRSNTPLQALVLLNDPSYVEAARALAGRIVNDGGGSISEQLEFAYQEVLSRPIELSEREVLATLYEKHLAAYDENAQAAIETQTVGQSQPLAGVGAAELAAWTSVARTILNLNETITRY